MQTDTFTRSLRWWNFADIIIDGLHTWPPSHLLCKYWTNNIEPNPQPPNYILSIRWGKVWFAKPIYGFQDYSIGSRSPAKDTGKWRMQIIQSKFQEFSFRCFLLVRQPLRKRKNPHWEISIELHLRAIFCVPKLGFAAFAIVLGMWDYQNRPLV